MADFRDSTHRSKWIFTSQQLVEKYASANRRAKQLLSKHGTAKVGVHIDGSLPCSTNDVTTTNGDKSHRAKPLTVEEEQFMRVYYEYKLREVCNAFYFPHKIQATALIYFKRFFLHWSVMEHDPKHIMLTCIYIACKIEENHVSAEELGKGISQDHQTILNYEMIVLQNLEFDLIVYAPYRSIDGFLADIEGSWSMVDGQDQNFKDFQNTARAEADRYMFTDAPLLFSPGQLALAALRSANRVHKVINFERYLEDINSHQNSGHLFTELTERLNAIDSLVLKHRFPSDKDMKHINRKLKSCWGLSSHEDKKREKKTKRKSHQI